MEDADGLTLTPVDPYLIEVKEVPIGRSRLLEIKGRMPGTTYLEVRGSHGPVTRLEVCVKIRRYVFVMFHYVEDTTGRRTRRKAGDEVTLLEQVNKIMVPQANVEFVRYGAKPLKVKSDLGNVVGADEKKSPSNSVFHIEWNAVVVNSDLNADLNVFFVWEFEGEHDTTPREDNAQAATKKAYGYTIFQDEGSEDGAGAGARVWPCAGSQ